MHVLLTIIVYYSKQLNPTAARAIVYVFSSSTCILPNQVKPMAAQAVHLLGLKKKKKLSYPREESSRNQGVSKESKYNVRSLDKFYECGKTQTAQILKSQDTLLS